MSATDPERLVQALLASGWQMAGKRKDVYTRLSRPDMPGQSIVVPATRRDVEDDLMFADALFALLQLAEIGRNACDVLDSLQLSERNDR